VNIAVICNDPLRLSFFDLDLTPLSRSTNDGTRTDSSTRDHLTLMKDNSDIYRNSTEDMVGELTLRGQCT